MNNELGLERGFKAIYFSSKNGRLSGALVDKRQQRRGSSKTELKETVDYIIYWISSPSNEVPVLLTKCFFQERWFSIHSRCHWS